MSPPAVHLRTRNKKYVFLVMAMLSFVQKFPKKTLTVPLKMLKLIYGMGVGNQPLKGLRNLTWGTSDAEALPVFERIEPDSVTKPTKIVVAFRPELLAAAERWRLPITGAGCFPMLPTWPEPLLRWLKGKCSETFGIGRFRIWPKPTEAEFSPRRRQQAALFRGTSAFVPCAGMEWCGSFTEPCRITVTFCVRERKSLRTLFWVRRQAPSLSRAGCVRDVV